MGEGDYDKKDDAPGERGMSHMHKKKHNRRPHYYGNAVRQFLFATGIVMLIGLPIFSAQINFPLFLPLFGILCINMVAGLTNPRQRMTILVDGIISFIGLAFFALIAYFQFDTFHNIWSWYFWFNQALGVLFFISLYYSVKTYRGMVLPDPEAEEEDY